MMYDSIKHTIIKGFDSVGFFGPQILFFSSVYLLFNKWTSLSVYFIGFFINIMLNVVLKALIQEPRPSEDNRLFNLQILSGKRIGHDRYGMPSGHAEGVFYSTAFIFLILKDKRIGVGYLIISLITLYQRLKYKNHTFEQVIAGAIIGAFMGLFFYYYRSNLLKGILKMKDDDDAPY
jgi:membrane-associated phospholipid phosphatase